MFKGSLLFKCAVERLKASFDAVIVGGGPSGLSAAIRLKQLNSDMRVALVEKGSMIGAHILGGACISKRALDEFLPGWKTMNSFEHEEVISDHFCFLTKKKKLDIRPPLLPRFFRNKGCYVVSLGELCKWLSEVAEEKGVEIYSGFGASDVYYGSEGEVRGVILNSTGINKKGEKADDYQPGMIFEAKQTLFAEGCRGSCTKKLEKKYNLRANSCCQTYALGVKEIWEIPKEKASPGAVYHTVGWPLTKAEGHENTYGGSFLYHYGDAFITTGFVIGLDYSNTYTNPYMEFQKWKMHPFIAELLKDGKPIAYGARALSEGGFQSIPKLSFPGGVLVGDCAGFLNLPKIKGVHSAMKSGTLAAEALFEEILSREEMKDLYGNECFTYQKNFENSWLYEELKEVRNVRPHFAKNFYFGMAYAGITAIATFGKEPWTLKHHGSDNEQLKPASECKQIEYPKPDNKLTFDILTNLSRSGTTHNADQPAHLKLKKWNVACNINLAKYAGPEGRYCPAKVYEFIEGLDGKTDLVINAQNCLHCKACDIKDPTQNIDWTCPEGGGGPNYNAQM